MVDLILLAAADSQQPSHFLHHARETSPLKTRVWGFRQPPSGRFSSRRRRTRAIAIGSTRCIYAIASGRRQWLNRDPDGERGGINLYGFVQDSPLNLVDTDGRGPIGAGIGAGIGGFIGGSIGAGFGGTGGIVVGGIGGTLIEPGGGTIVGGIGGGLTGAEIGAGIGTGVGVAAGAAVGNWVGDALDDLVTWARNESGQRNYINDKAADVAKREGKDLCAVLAAMMQAAKCSGNTKLQQEIKQAQKAAGCRHNNG